MSVASVSSYINDISNRVYGIGDSIKLNIVPSGTPIASNTIYTFLPLTASIPKGRWILSGTIGCTRTSGADVIETIDVVLYKNGITPLAEIYSALTAGNSFTANQTIPAIIFISDGTDKITGQVNCLVSGSGAGTWNIDDDDAGAECFLEMIRISNEGYI